MGYERDISVTYKAVLGVIHNMLSRNTSFAVKSALSVLKAFGMSKLWKYQDIKDLFKECIKKVGEREHLDLTTRLCDSIKTKCIGQIRPEKAVQVIKDYIKCSSFKGTDQQEQDNTIIEMWNTCKNDVKQTVAEAKHYKETSNIGDLKDWLVCLKCILNDFSEHITLRKLFF